MTKSRVGGLEHGLIEVMAVLCGRTHSIGAMRYFFDINDGILRRDLEGMELPDLDAVRDNAMRLGAAWAGRSVVCDGGDGAIVVEVHEPDGRCVMAVRPAADD